MSHSYPVCIRLSSLGIVANNTEQQHPPTLNRIIIAYYVIHAQNISKTDRQINILA